MVDPCIRKKTIKTTRSKNSVKEWTDVNLLQNSRHKQQKAAVPQDFDKNHHQPPHSVVACIEKNLS